MGQVAEDSNLRPIGYWQSKSVNFNKELTSTQFYISARFVVNKLVHSSPRT